MKVEFKDITYLKVKTIELVRKWRNSDSIRKYMCEDHIISKREHRTWLRGIKRKNTVKFWVIYLNNLPVGSVYLGKIDYKNKTADWGFYIADESLRGKGIGSLALFWLMWHTFDTMKFRKMYTTVLRNNPGALRLYTKFGFVKEGVMKEQLFRDKKAIDLVLMGILRKKWISKRHRIKTMVQNRFAGYRDE